MPGRVHECLEKNENHKKKNDGFSKGCYSAHEAFEAAEQGSGKKHDESAEHQDQKPAQ